MKKFLIVIAMLSAMLFGVSTAFAATAQLDNLPGGAGFAYIQASKAGHSSLFNIQNIDGTAIMVHIVVSDRNSNEIMDFAIPLSPFDNWGASITGDGTNATLTPQGCPGFYGGGASGGCFASLTSALPADASGMQRGYISFTIKSGDSAWYGGNGDGDPRNDPLFGAAFSTRHRDVLVARVALLEPGFSSAFAMNAFMLQGFVNIVNFGQTQVVSWNSIADAANATFRYQTCPPTALSTAVLASSDNIFSNGSAIDSWEIFLTDSANWSIISDDTNADAVGDTLYPAVGSPHDAFGMGHYWARWNLNPDPSVGTNTNVIVVFPTNSGINHVLPCGYTSRAISGNICDDNEFCPSFPTKSPVEVDVISVGPAGILTPGSVSGEIYMSTQAPMVGFSYTTSPHFADLYPIVREGAFISTADSFNDALWGVNYAAIVNLSGYAFDPATSEVIEVSLQETHR